MFSKKDLKDGMIVKNDFGKFFLVVADTLLCEYSYMPLDRFRDDLTSNSYHDIVKVWEIKEPFHRHLRVFENIEHVEKVLEPIFDRNAEVDWSKVEVDTKVLVSDNAENWYPRHFAKYEDGKVYSWVRGKTSYTADEDECNTWKYTKLEE